MLKAFSFAYLLTAACLVAAAQPAKPDFTRQPTLYVVPYAHLDTEWRWEYPTTIGQYIPDTIHRNLELFAKYPHYTFSFSGSNRYRMMKEYYPADYEKVKQAVSAGRWFVAGSAMEESDVNNPSAESIMRQVLYGKQFNRKEFGRTSAEFMLPDCFGFPASLPSILAHTGVKGFSTQKLSWRSANGIPFNVGVWEGLDGKSVVAALNAMDYNGDVTEDLSKSPTWLKRIQENGARSGLFVDYMYYGTGDIGGSPREASVKFMEALLTKSVAAIPPAPRRGPPGAASPAPAEPGPAVQVGDGPIQVVQTSAEQMFNDITPGQAARLPRYKGDLLLVEHSAGSITSQAYMKRWNRQNEVLADAAERASVAAALLGARPYPKQRLNDAWNLVMGGQFHDIIPGTSTPKAYEYAWNDQVLALNQFSSVLTSAASGVVGGMNTLTRGIPVVVFNPLSIPREDVVEVAVKFPKGTPKAVRAIAADTVEVKAQVVGEKDGLTRVLILAKAPANGFAVYDLQPALTAPPSLLKVSENALENARYRVEIASNGDVSSVFDKVLKKELLSAPIRLAFQTEKPSQWPAWNMDWNDRQKPPRGFVSGPAKIRVVENGPARVAVEIERESEGSKFQQVVRLSGGTAGNRVEFANVVEWRTREAALKATFALTASNPKATYNWDIGTIERGNNSEKQFEVPSHQWFDLTDASGAYGVTVLTDTKNASDKPDDTTLRLTLLYTPGISDGGRGYADQATQDWGRHEILFGLAAHAGDWRKEQTDWQALRLNQPLLAFESARHLGPIGKVFSLMKVANPRVRVLALKQAEQSDEIVVRLVELDGRPADKVKISFAAPILAAREVNGAEEPVGDVPVTQGTLLVNFTPYQPRTFAVKLGATAYKLSPPRGLPVEVAFDRAVASRDGAKSDGGFDSAGRALPAEMLPSQLDWDGISFRLGAAGANAATAQGQTINLPEGKYKRVYILAAAEGDQQVEFGVGAARSTATIPDWGGFIGQWDNRQWTKHEEPMPARPGAPAPAGPPRMRTVLDYQGLTPGFVKPTAVAWFASHTHSAEGANEPYAFSYLFAQCVEIPTGAKTLTLPANGKVRILAVTAADGATPLRVAHPLFDTLER